MQVIVSDASCLIDLRKAFLLEAFVRLPYELVIPYTLFHDELVRFTPAQLDLLERHVDIRDVPGPLVESAIGLLATNPALTVNDCFAYVLADSISDSILLTGDGALRALAARNGLNFHGVLWVLDVLAAERIVPQRAIARALELFRDDATVHIPQREILRYLVRYGRRGR